MGWQDKELDVLSFILKLSNVLKPFHYSFKYNKLHNDVWKCF